MAGTPSSFLFLVASYFPGCSVRDVTLGTTAETRNYGFLESPPVMWWFQGVDERHAWIVDAEGKNWQELQSNESETTSDGLQTTSYSTSDGLHPSSDGLQPKSDGAKKPESL